MVKIATWNVNSIRIRLDLLSRLVKQENPEIICLQEVKAKEADFPFDAVQSLGFNHIALYSIPAYNGVAILSKIPLQRVEKHQHVGRDDARHISAIIGHDTELHNIYIPAGGDIPDIDSNPSFRHKLQFVDELADFFEHRPVQKRIICGDFNIAPNENDVWNHKAMLKIISHTPIEVEKLTGLYKRGNFVDTVRQFYGNNQKLYSWWGYRNLRWQANDKGRRLDHIWCSPQLASDIKNISFCKEFRFAERPSDHIPVIAEIKL